MQQKTVTGSSGKFVSLALISHTQEHGLEVQGSCVGEHVDLLCTVASEK